jgi:hypothetical protein
MLNMFSPLAKRLLNLLNYRLEKNGSAKSKSMSKLSIDFCENLVRYQRIQTTARQKARMKNGKAFRIPRA